MFDISPHELIIGNQGAQKRFAMKLELMGAAARGEVTTVVEIDPKSGSTLEMPVGEYLEMLDSAENGTMSTPRQPRGIPVGGQFAANEHDEASPMLVGDTDAYREETESLLETASEIVGCSMTFQREDGKLIATVYSDDGDVIEHREVTISFGEPMEEDQ